MRVITVIYEKILSFNEIDNFYELQNQICEAEKLNKNLKDRIKSVSI